VSNTGLQDKIGQMERVCEPYCCCTARPSPAIASLSAMYRPKCSTRRVRRRILVSTSEPSKDWNRTSCNKWRQAKCCEMPPKLNHMIGPDLCRLPLSRLVLRRNNFQKSALRLLWLEQQIMRDRRLSTRRLRCLLSSRHRYDIN
jgi:hypothetical protein